MGKLAMTGTFSKSPLAWGLSEDLYVTKAQGQKVRLSDGRYYLDWVNGLGTNLFGYAYFKEEIANEAAKGGGSHSLPHRLEYEAAGLLCGMLSENIDHWNDKNIQARFSLSGTDAVNVAVRLARAVTGRDNILVMKNGYHGWADWTIARTEPAAGIPEGYKESIVEFELDDWESIHNEMVLATVKNRKNKPAAIVIEQGLTDPDDEFYNWLRDLCDLGGVLLIIDEVVTGLRYGLGGACQRYGIKPDIVCMGKALGNGYPISAIVGDVNLMSEFAKVSPVFCSSTHWGNSINMAAAVAVLSRWDHACVEHIWSMGTFLIEGLRSAGWNVIGHPPRSLVTFKSPEEHAFFIQGMMGEGIMMNRPNFPTLSTTEKYVDDTFEAAKRVRHKFKVALERGVLQDTVKGKLPRVLFSDR